MTKADRDELEKRLNALDYWRQLAYRNAIELRVNTKREVLQELRAGVL